MGAVASSPVCVFVGLPGSGKTTAGKRLSRALHLPFLDSDQVIEERYGKSCGEVFAELGEPAFRAMEEDVVADCLATHAGVLSLGGGAVLSPRTRLLLADVPVVFLDISAAEGIRRTIDTATRPVLAAADPAAHYRQLRRTRHPYYEEVANLTIQPEHRKPADVIDEICAYLGRPRLSAEVED